MMQGGEFFSGNATQNNRNNFMLNSAVENSVIAEYILSGHIHGRVVSFFGKGIFSPERKFFPPYSKGVYDVNGIKLLVSGGLGKFRLFNPPEVVIYKI